MRSGASGLFESTKTLSFAFRGNALTLNFKSEYKDRVQENWDKGVLDCSHFTEVARKGQPQFEIDQKVAKSQNDKYKQNVNDFTVNR